MKDSKLQQKPSALKREHARHEISSLYLFLCVIFALLDSVADPGCLSRIPDSDFYPSRIPDLGSRISDPGSRIPDLGSRITDHGSKNSNKREGWKKIVTKLSKVWIRDPEKTNSGSRIQGSKRHRILDPDPQHCSWICIWIKLTKSLWIRIHNTDYPASYRYLLGWYSVSSIFSVGSISPTICDNSFSVVTVPNGSVSPCNCRWWWFRYPFHFQLH